MVRALRSLADLHEGEHGLIRDIDGNGLLATRLLDLGFVPGTPVQALRRAPLGDPMTFQIQGYRISLRGSEARLIKLD